MLRQRPAPTRIVGAVGVLGLLLAGCGTGPVSIESPPLSGPDAATCADLVRAMPSSVADQQRREVEPADATVAAWGDPAIELRCGVPRPAGFTRFSICQETNGVGWFIPERQIERGPGEIVMTTISHEPRVEVRLPADYWPPAAAMVDLADAIKGSLRETAPCV